MPMHSIFSSRSRRSKQKQKMARIRGWVESGDRSHPNLKLVDSYRYQLTYPHHSDDLKTLERFHLSGDIFQFEQTLHKVTESQKIHVGDRSHPRVAQLDALLPSLNYDGWKHDRDKAMKEHVSLHYDGNFHRLLTGMKRKQALHVGDRTHDHIQFLDSLSLSYPGWEKDARSAMASHLMGHCMSSEQFWLTERQRMHEGNRSHPRLVALDALKLSYPGWEADVKEVERRHIRDFWHQSGLSENCEAMLSGLTRKQWEFEGDDKATISMSMHPFLKKIVETKWTYLGWQRDIEDAKSSFRPCLHEQDLGKFQIRQMIHDNDYGHHPALIMLAQKQLSYPGWEADLKSAKVYLARNGYQGFSKKHFNEMIQGTKNKQNVYNGLEHPKERRSDSRLGTCAICLETTRTHVFVPCGHICVCAECSRKVMEKDRKCPMCKQTATMTVEVFLP